MTSAPPKKSPSGQPMTRAQAKDLGTTLAPLPDPLEFFPVEDDRRGKEVWQTGPATTDISRKKDGTLLRTAVKEPLNDFHPAKGDACYFHFSIALCSIGRKIYDSRVDDFALKGDPVTVTVGSEENIELFNRALPTIRSGEVVRITAKSQAAWGVDGWKDIPVPVPPNADVVVEIEMVAFDLGEDLTWEQNGQVRRSRQTLGDPLKESAKDGDIVEISITGRIGPQPFLQRDSMKYELGKAVEYDLPHGVDIALRKFELGERALLWIGRKYCYGQDCNKLYNIPEGSGINFDVTLLAYEKPTDQTFDSKKDQILARNMLKAERLKERGNTLFKQARMKEALKEYNQVIKLLESIIPHLPIQGLVEGIHIRGITKQVQDSYWASHKPKRDELYVSALLNSALCYIKLEDGGEAVRMCSAALKEQPKNIKALYRRGTAWFAQGDFEEALGNFEKVLRLEKTDQQLIAKVERDIDVCQRNLKVTRKAEERDLFRQFGRDEHGKEIEQKDPKWNLR